ncbi:MAG: hypothetical protein RLY93_02555 [Sumerlaeia bacterium]
MEFRKAYSSRLENHPLWDLSLRLIAAWAGIMIVLSLLHTANVGRELVAALPLIEITLIVFVAGLTMYLMRALLWARHYGTLSPDASKTITGLIRSGQFPFKSSRRHHTTHGTFFGSSQETPNRKRDHRSSGFCRRQPCPSGLRGRR